MADISKIKLPNGTTYNIKDAEAYRPGWYGNGTTDIAMRSLVAYSRANRLAFLPADQVIIEETTDGGQTWTSGDYTDESKQALFATRGTSIKIPLLNGKKSTNCGVRITITGMKYNVPDGTSETEKYNYWNAEYVKSIERYCNLREMWFWMSATNDTVRCQVYRATGANPNNWAVCFDTDFGMTGWSGSDWIRFNGNWTFGGGITQTGNFWNWRIIFWSRMADGKDAFNSNTQQFIMGINGYGDNVWNTTNNLMKEDHLYTWDVNMNAAFPARVQAATFKGVGTELTALNGSNISSGTVAEARIAALPASKITSGTFDVARIPNLNAGKITSGTIASERLPVMEGATEENNGTSGIVPAPTTEDKNYFLKGDGTWSALTAPIATKTYTDIIATSNDNVGGAFFYLKVRANSWTDKWHVKTKVFATVPGNALYETETYFDIWGYENTYGGYICKNYVRNTSYRPIYYNNYFRIAKTGYDNGCGGWIGFSLYNSTNPLDTSLKRTVTVDLLEYENCTVDFQDSLITPTNIPERAAHTSYYSSTNTSFDNFDAAGQGIKSSGDNNTTSISNLYYYNGNFIADSPIYRYKLLFHVDDDTLSPLNNDNNVTNTTKTLLTNLEFYPFKDIFYYNSTTIVNANAAISAGSCFYSMSGVDLRHTFNITTSTLTAHKNVYLKLTPTSGSLAKLASDSPLTQDLPASEDGYLYLLLGRAYSGYQLSLYPKHPIYAYKDGKIVTIKPSNIELASDPTTNLGAATKQYVDNNVSISETLSTGTQIGIINIGGTNTTLYAPAAPPTAEFIVSTNTGESAVLTGILADTTTIANGKIIYYMTQYQLPNSELSLQLRYGSSSNYTPEIPIYNYGNIRCITPYPASYILTLIYYNNAFYIANPISIVM